MSVSLGQSIIIENRSGGGGSIGTTAAARAEPDGYTLLVASSATHSILPAMFEKLDYDPISSFAPIAGMSIAPYLLVVNAEVPVTNAERTRSLRQGQPRQAQLCRGHGNAAAHPCLRLQGVDRDGFRCRPVPGRRTRDGRPDGQPGSGDLPADNHRHCRLPTTSASGFWELLRSSGRACCRCADLAEQGFPQLVANSWNGLVGAGRHARAGDPAA